MSRMDVVLREQLCRRLVQAAHAVYGPDVHGVIIKGSCLTDDFIPYYSDFDMHLFISDEQLSAPRLPRIEHALAFQEAIGDIQPVDFQVSVLEIYFVPWFAGYPSDWAKPWPGTYQVVDGAIPAGFTEVTVESYLQRANQHLGWFSAWIDELSRRVAIAQDEQLPELVRQLGAILKPLTYVLTTLLTGHPEWAWKLPLATALEIVVTAVPSGALSEFFTLVSRWPLSSLQSRQLIAIAYRAVAEVREWDRQRPKEVSPHEESSQRSWL